MWTAQIQNKTAKPTSIFRKGHKKCRLLKCTCKKLNFAKHVCAFLTDAACLSGLKYLKHSEVKRINEMTKEKTVIRQWI